MDITGEPDGIAGLPKPTMFGLPMTRNPATEGGTTCHAFFNIEFSKLVIIQLVIVIKEAS